MNAQSPQRREIACQQVLRKDASVYSIQYMVLPQRYAEGVTPDALLERYLRHIRRFSLGLVRPVTEEKGCAFRLAASRLALLSFTPPARSRKEGAESLTLAINGGLLVQAECCDRGELTFSCEPVEDGLRVTLLLADYCPLLLGGPTPGLFRKWLYRLTQALIHKVVTVRFLARLYRELAGKGACIRTVKTRVVEGEEI